VPHTRKKNGYADRSAAFLFDLSGLHVLCLLLEAAEDMLFLDPLEDIET
jgi:hypothetical protein